jgi:hypothetical protein
MDHFRMGAFRLFAFASLRVQIRLRAWDRSSELLQVFLHLLLIDVIIPRIVLSFECFRERFRPKTRLELVGFQKLLKVFSLPSSQVSFRLLLVSALAMILVESSAKLRVGVRNLSFWPSRKWHWRILCNFCLPAAFCARRARQLLHGRPQGGVLLCREWLWRLQQSLAESRGTT